MSRCRSSEEQYAVQRAYWLGEDIADLFVMSPYTEIRVKNRIISSVRDYVHGFSGSDAARAFILGFQRSIRAVRETE